MRFLRKRCAALFCIFILFFGVIFIRLAYLTNGLGSVAASESQLLQTLTVASKRGFITDRNGEAISGRQTGWYTIINPSYEFSDAQIAALSSSSLLDDYEVQALIDGDSIFVLETSNEFESDSLYSLPKYDVAPYAAAHLIGYTDSDGHGVCGLQRDYDELLTSASGRSRLAYRKSATGKLLGGLAVSLYDKGYSSDGGLELTLDLSLQRFVESLDIEAGAVVAADCETGELLCCASFPGYDTSRVADYLNSERGELINRAFTPFTPGSLFKIVTAAALLEKNTYYINLIHNCDGTRRYAGIPHGMCNMTDAIAHSCNEYFMTAAEKLDEGALEAEAQKLGIGCFPSIDGVYCGSGSFDGTVLSNAAIGQGGTLVTPIEVTRILCAVENGGIAPELSLIRSMTLADGTKTEISHDGTSEFFSDQIASMLRKMLLAVVSDGIGSAALPEGFDNLVVGGKTASAQSGQFTESDGEKTELIHSWFAGFCEVNDGEKLHKYAVTVLLDIGGSGASAYFAQIAAYLAQNPI